MRSCWGFYPEQRSGCHLFPCYRSLRRETRPADLGRWVSFSPSAMIDGCPPDPDTLLFIAQLARTHILVT